jgi:hypothetical protein
MSSFSIDIVEWLFENNIKPYTNSQPLFTSPYDPFQGINYSNTNTKYYINLVSYKNKWWMINFRKYIILNSYQISAYKGCNWIRNWNVSISLDGIKWEYIDSRKNSFVGDDPYILDKEYVARYFKIEGNSIGCTYPNYLAFYNIKFFGSIATDDLKFTCQLSKKVINMYIYLALFLIK